MLREARREKRYCLTNAHQPYIDVRMGHAEGNRVVLIDVLRMLHGKKPKLRPAE